MYDGASSGSKVKCPGNPKKASRGGMKLAKKKSTGKATKRKTY